MAEKFPQQFGSYILLRKIAMGGMAEIFRGKTVGAEGFEKDLVIKRILPHYTEDEDFVKMFIDEASIAAKLQHSNIVQVFDFNVVDGCYYIAMEYVEGKDLKNLIDAAGKQDKPLTPSQCVWIIMELSKGLHHAHIKSYKGKPLNIVHRDISPQNAMISFNGEIKLMDFGIAKAAARSTKTVAGTVKGKCAYMSPEQARGKPLDGRSDLFGLAVVLWEMLTHKRLFLGNSDFVTLSNVLKQEAPAPSSINPDVPKELDAIVLKALAKDREERHETVEHFAREMTKWFYASVDDLDSVAIGPVMKDMFKEDLEQLAKWSQEENDMLVKAHDEASSSKKTKAVINEDATVAIPAADFDPQSAKTVMEGDLSADQVKQAMARQAASGEATVALDAASIVNTATGTASVAGTGTHSSGGSKLWIIIALVLLVGGGVAAAVLLSGKKAEDKEKTPITEMEPEKKGTETPVTVVKVKVRIVPDPPDAIVFADDKVVKKSDSGSYYIEREVGATVIIEVKTKDGQSRAETIKVSDENRLFKISVKGEAAAAELRFDVDPADAVVLVNLQPIERGATGMYVYKGKIGEEVTVQARTKAGKKGPEKTIKLSKDIEVVTLSAGPPDPTLKVTCKPADAAVTTTLGDVTAADGYSMVGGPALKKGHRVTVTCTKEGYLKRSKHITLKHGKNTIRVEMSKPGEYKPSGHGSVFVNSLPWAKCTLKGVTKTTPATFKGVPAGRHRVSCKNAAANFKKARTITVKANGLVKVIFKRD